MLYIMYVYSDKIIFVTRDVTCILTDNIYDKKLLLILFLFILLFNVDVILIIVYNIGQ